MTASALNKIFPYREALAAKGVWASTRFLIMRRVAQLLFLALFLTGPLLGVWVTKGTLASSMTFNLLPLTDGFVFVQVLAARHWPEASALIGAGIVIGFYSLLGGRSFCAWVCPINPVTDLAAFVRRRFDVKYSAKLRPQTRLYVMIAVLVTAALTGLVVWEFVNPVTSLHRALVFGSGFGALSALAIFIFDALIAKNGWCGHLCPVGAFYGLIGKGALLRVSAPRRVACDDCMSCFAVCPEPHVITPALRGEKTGHTPVIVSGDCTLCGACVDVCPETVFAFTHRFDQQTEPVSPAECINLSRSEQIQRSRQ